MIIKIVGFKVKKDRSTCYYKVDIRRVGMDLLNDEERKDMKFKLGHKLWMALEKSDFVSERK